MIYHIKYKTIMIPPFFDNLVPYIFYIYKADEKDRFWHLGFSHLDTFAFKNWNSYYDDDWSLSLYDDFYRVKTLRTIIDEQYGGSLRNYVKAMVAYKKALKKIEKDNDTELLKLRDSFHTTKWMTATIISDEAT